MPDRSYLGIDITSNNEWIVALLVDGKASFIRTFKNTTAELLSLVRFISEHCLRPKICLKPTGRAALRLLKLISEIPDVEVVLMSEAGLKMHRAWLSPAWADGNSSTGTHQAFTLARCAQRMI